MTKLCAVDSSLAVTPCQRAMKAWAAAVVVSGLAEVMREGVDAVTGCAGESNEAMRVVTQRYGRLANGVKQPGEPWLPRSVGAYQKQ